MPVRQASGFFNSPQFAQAAGNLAQLFAPLSGTDTYAYAKAAQEKDQTARLADLYAHATNDDQRAVIAGLYNPTQSYRALDLDNGTKRYGIDVGAETSRSNNAADNARALQDRQLQEAGSLQRLYAQPVKVGKDENVFLPQQTASATGLPQAIAGNIEVGQGGTTFATDGRVLHGSTAPLTVDQKAAALLSDDQIRQAALGKEAPVIVTGGADGKTPVYASPGAAVMGGLSPYKPGGDKPLVEGTALVNGKTVPVFRDQDSLQYTTADGAPIPNNIQVFEKARPVGTSEQIGMKSTEGSDKAGMFYNRAAPASDNLNKAMSEGYVPADTDYEFSLGSLSGAPNAIANRMVSDKGRDFYNNAQNFMMAVLRPDTGAAFGKDEFQSYAKVFIPLPGDDAQTLQNKAVARQTALSALQGTSHGSAQQIAQILQQNGLPIPKEMADVIARGGIGQQAPAVSSVMPTSDAPVASAAPAPVAAAPSSGGIPEGTMARNKAGQTIVLRGGQWVPYVK